MEPISSIPRDVARSIKYVLTDIDDTLTASGKLQPEAFRALWDLKDEGIQVVPVTGRPAGWCDCILRQWPVAAVIGENGAFAYLPDKKGITVVTHPEADSKRSRDILEKVREAVLREIPGTRIAKDQPFRIYDLAIDFREDEPDLGFETAERIAELCRSFGAEAKISSIHVNVWFGAYDKYSMSRFLLKNYFGEEDILKTTLFCGDSPNDEPMFQVFPCSCAVANISVFLENLKHKPAYITLSSYGEGFAEMTGELLKRRG
ncbi:MAG: HAD-IIB family hydrolase [Spirochaetales bacterium]|nr:HAD-IIB family hydrolase [Spirochaetales bacterium]